MSASVFIDLPCVLAIRLCVVHDSAPLWPQSAQRTQSARVAEFDVGRRWMMRCRELCCSGRHDDSARHGSHNAYACLAHLAQSPAFGNHGVLQADNVDRLAVDLSHVWLLRV